MPHIERPRRVAVGLVVLVMVVLVVIGFGFYQGDDGVPGTTTVAPRPLSDRAVTRVEELIAAFNEFDRVAFADLLTNELQARQWPQSSAQFGGEFRIDAGWFDFRRSLGSRIEVRECSSRAPRGDGAAVYDVLVECTVDYTDAVLEALGATGISGLLEVGLAGEQVAGTFWLPRAGASTRAAADLVGWMQDHQPHLATHWLGVPFGEPLFGPELAGVLETAARAHVQVDTGAPDEAAGPVPAAGHRLAADPDGGIVMVVPSSGQVGRAGSRAIWRLAPDGSWDELASPVGSFWSASVAIAGDRPVIVAVTDGTAPSVVALVFDDARSGWTETSRVGPFALNGGIPPLFVDADVDADGDRVLVAGWPPALYEYDAGTSRLIEHDAAGVLCLAQEIIAEPLVVADPAEDAFFVIAGPRVCRLRLGAAEVEVFPNEAPTHVYAAGTDPVGGALLLVGDGEMWRWSVDGPLESVGPLPDGMLWRNAEMASRTADVVLFDGQSLWTFDPVVERWSETADG